MGTEFQPVDVELLRTAGITRVDNVERVSGGYINDVLRVNGRVVLRRWTRPGVASLEIAALREAREDGVPVPEVLAASGDRAVLSWVDGVRADTVRHGRTLGRTLGELANSVWERKRPSAGELTWSNDGWQITPWPADGSTMLNELLTQATDAPPGWRELAAEHAVDLETDPVRVHADLNPKNVLLKPDGSVAALLDWEFTFAGPRETDLGNLLRFEHRHCRTPFEMGVLEATGADEDALDRGRRLDLLSLAQFLAPRPDSLVRRRVRALAARQVAANRI
ncbi:hypothetical protein Lesp02_37760 [Lentzea sp. NBRC 105346]|uniref:phosphotransferase n=1 Tax=Lentzea sp. NBRC 105346 TaxID=3032205 RepID=UPI00249FEEF3|nr:phosphotransferase [Lentzea sp. NBRC 105346]GLZ31588.1 hypothetical protein Lesp02_37760 [Lentzea sp. NBRC 105346]